MGSDQTPPAATRTAGPPAPDQRASSNLVLWAAFATVSMVVGMRFIWPVHGRFSLDLLLGIAMLAVRTALYVSLGMFLESLLLRARDGYLAATPRRRLALHAFWVLVMFATVLFTVDMLVFSFAGYHLLMAGQILFSDGPAGAGKVVEATGLSPSMILSATVALVAGLGIAAFLSSKTMRLSQRWNVTITRRTALRAGLASFAVLGLLEFLGHRIRDPYLWEQEIRRVPMAFAIARPQAALASFRVGLHQPEVLPVESAILRTPTGEVKPDIYLFLIESLRKDLLTPKIMPRFAAFAEKAWTFEHPVTTGNVTHYSWYGLLCANDPIFFDVAKHNATAQGSAPLALLRRMGYRIRLFATPDTAYQNLEAVVFGPQGGLLDEKFHPSERLPADRDRHVIEELVRDIHEKPPGGRFHLVALDSTHFDYAWGADFTPPFTPFAATTSIIENYHEDANARRLVENRYHNAAAWVDSLLGRFLDALAASGRLEHSIVIITGDHGEAFWEHGVGTHGSDLAVEQLEVAMAMRFPGEAPRRFEGVFPLLDVLPTVLANRGWEPGKRRPFAGAPLQQRFGDPAALRTKGYAVTFQGWNERAFRFALSYGEKRVLLELDRPDPREAQQLSIKHLSHGMETGPMGGPLDPAAYRELLGDLPRIMECLPFLEFR
jgi:hypothetical protein